MLQRSRTGHQVEPKNFQGKTLTRYDGFWVLPELLTRCGEQLSALARTTPVQRQFIGTMIDTEVAAGYYIRKTNASGATWVAYVAVKMKYPGDLIYMAELVSHLPPSRGCMQTR